MKTGRRSNPPVFALVCCATITVLSVTVVFGQPVAQPSGGSDREEVQPNRVPPPFAKGTIDSIDLFRHQIKLKTKTGVRPFTYTATTYIFRGKEKIAAEGLKPGEVIALRYYTDPEGQVLVRRIKAYGPPPAAESQPVAPSESAK